MGTTMAAEQRRTTASLTAELAALGTMTVNELAGRYREVYGEPSRSRNRDYLRKKVAWRIQEIREGGLSDRAKARIAELAPNGPVQWRRPLPAFPDTPTPTMPARDPRLPAPGTTIKREHRGVQHIVTVLDDGFEYAGQTYPTLSKIARAITGTNWNGYLFFGLDNRVGKAAPATTEARS